MKSSAHLICSLPGGVEQSPCNLVGALPDDFTPLRLIQQPGKIVLVLSQPRIVLGRHSLADVRLLVPYVSRKHCLIEYTQRKWLITDLGSLNGVVVNRQKVEHAELTPGAFLEIGGLTFRVEDPAQTALDDADRMIFQITDSKPGSSATMTGHYRAA